MASDEELPAAEGTSKRTGRLGRRRFLGVVASTAGAALLPAGCATSANPPLRSFAVVAEALSLTAREWAVLEALQDRLLPSAPGSPGARDVNAIRFLDAVLARGEVSKRIDARIRAGVLDLEAAAATRGAASFQDLDEAGREAAMVSIACRYKGRRFLRYVLIHTLEAFLGDPVHGGNPEEIAWQYLGHRAGYPRPSGRALKSALPPTGGRSEADGRNAVLDDNSIPAQAASGGHQANHSVFSQPAKATVEEP